MKLKNPFRKKQQTMFADPSQNPLAETICFTTEATILGETQPLTFRWIKNSEGSIKGAQSAFQYHGDRVPLIVSAPKNADFSLGINIGISKELVLKLKRELAQLQAKGAVSEATSLMYVQDFNGVLLWRKAGSKPVNNNVEYWKSLIRTNTQLLIDDFVAFMPSVMEIYGE